VSCVAVPAKVDLFEINKVFASVAIHPIRDLDIGSVVVNVNGDAVAMGHPPASSTSTYQPKKSAQQDPLLDVPSLRVHGRVSPGRVRFVEAVPPSPGELGNSRIF
jgi:Thiolase, C-terminal domain